MSSRRCEATAPNHGSVEAELHAVALQPHDELLARPDADVLAARGEVGLGRGDEAGRAAPRSRRHSSASGKSPGRSGRRSPARGRRRGCSAGHRRAAGGASPKCPRLARFERRRSCSSYVARMPWRSTAFATRSARCVNTRFMRAESFVRCLCMVLSAVGRESPTLPAATGDLRLLPLPRCAAAARGARSSSRARPARYSLYGMDQLADRGFAVRHNLERSRAARVRRGRPGACSSAASRRQAATAATSRRSSRREGRSIAPTSSSRPWTRSGSRSCSSHRAASCARRSSTPRSGCPSASRSSGRSAWSGSTRGALGAAYTIVAYSEHEADVLAAVAAASGARTRASSSCRSAWTSRRSGRPARLRTSTSSRSAPILTATSSCC